MYTVLLQLLFFVEWRELLVLDYTGVNGCPQREFPPFDTLMDWLLTIWAICHALLSKLFLTVMRLMSSYRIHNGTPFNSIDLDPCTRKIMDAGDYSDYHHLFFKNNYQLLHLHLCRIWNSFHCWSVQILCIVLHREEGGHYHGRFVYLTSKL